MAARPARRFFQTRPTMAYPQGRVAVYVPALAQAFVVTHLGRWSAIPGRDKPAREWTRLSAKAARDRLAQDGAEHTHENIPT